MNWPTSAQVAAQKANYPVGTRVELISCTDQFTDLKPGDQGVVRYVDDIGTCHIIWDNGSSLGMALGEDVIKKLPQIAETIIDQINKVRISGKANMLAIHDVQRIAFDNMYCELVDFIETNPKAYQRFILTGVVE
jgi:hypothetical protein